MKTTVDLPDPLFREAKATAAAQGQTLKSFISDSVRQRLRNQKDDWRAVLKNLPRVKKQTAEEIMQTVNDYDAIDLEFQKQAMKSENAR